MIKMTEQIKQFFLSLRNKYVDYKTPGEFGRSAFWLWYDMIKKHIKRIPNNKVDSKNSSQIYDTVFWGEFKYDIIYIGNEKCYLITQFQMDYVNFQQWLQHKPIRKKNEPRYTTLYVDGYGFTIAEDDFTLKQFIISPTGTKICEPVFDDIIGFHHSQTNYNHIHAIGFINDRVYSIELDGSNPNIYGFTKEQYLTFTTNNDKVNDDLSKIIMKELKSCQEAPTNITLDINGNPTIGGNDGLDFISEIFNINKIKNVMKRTNKQALYESIMRKVSKVVKNAINEDDKFTSMSKDDIIKQAKSFFEKNDFRVDEYEEGGDVLGFELEKHTSGGVDMLIFLDGRDVDLNDPEWWKDAFRDYVDNFDIDEEIDVNRQDKRYRADFTYKESVADFEEWLDEMEQIKNEL